MPDFSAATYITTAIMTLFALWVLASLMRNGWFQNMKHASIWILIFVGTVAGFGIWQDIQQGMGPRQTVFSEQGRIEVPRDRDGHYYLTLELNGAPVEFVVDTGATDIVLTQQDAKAAGLAIDDLNYIGRAFTANGEVRTAPVRLKSVSVGGIEDSNVLAYVNEGDLFQSLLGMRYLQNWDRIEISAGKLILSR